MEDTVNQLIAEVQRLRTDQQSQAGVIANLRQELATAQTARGGASGTQKMDTLNLGRPPMFTGDEAAFEDCEMESASDALDFDMHAASQTRRSEKLVPCTSVCLY
eukprot:393971-Amphidinium_carterae.1